MSRMEAITAIDDGCILNISGCNENAFTLILGPARLIKAMTIMVIKKDHPILIKKGISYSPALLGKAVYSIVSVPRTFTANCPKNIEQTKPVIIPARAAEPVVLFQNIPKIKHAKTPGLI